MIRGMAREIRMPKLGQTSDEVHLIRWHVMAGDTVKKGDPLCEVENDKTTMDLESFADGTVLRLMVPPDSVVSAGAVIALIGEPGEVETGSPTPEAPPTPPVDIGAPESTRRHAESTVTATRLVRHLAEKRGIDLASVRGTGPSGLVVVKDLEAPAAAAQGATVALSGQQLQLGRLLAESKARVPHYYVESRFLCERLVELRERKRAREGDTPAVDSLFILAAAAVLRRFSRINSSFRDGNLHASDRINVAFAVSVRDELFAPVVRDADGKNLEEIDRDVRRLTAKARDGRLDREDISDATFTISNLGMYAVDSFQAIITPPQVAVLAIGRIRKVMDVEDNNSFRVRPACSVWGSFDHRAVNGAQGAEFLQALKRFVEEEIQLI